MIELRQTGKEKVQGDVKSAGNANKGDTFSKWQENGISGVIEY
jgi:hypothetical protein